MSYMIVLRIKFWKWYAPNIAHSPRNFNIAVKIRINWKSLVNVALLRNLSYQKFLEYQFFAFSFVKLTTSPLPSFSWSNRWKPGRQHVIRAIKGSKRSRHGTGENFFPFALFVNHVKPDVVTRFYDRSNFKLEFSCWFTLGPKKGATDFTTSPIHCKSMVFHTIVSWSLVFVSNTPRQWLLVRFR